MANLEQFIQNMVNMCNDNSYGYRLGGWGPKDYDCASSIITALRNAGFDTGSATYTGNMAAELCAREWTRLPVGTSLNRGDILLNEVNHVALYVGNTSWLNFLLITMELQGTAVEKKRVCMGIIISRGIVF